MFALDDTSRLAAVIHDLAAALSHKKPSGHCLVHGELLPERDTDKFLFWFHIDQNEEDQREKLFFCHFTFVRQPTTPPPEMLAKRRAEGITVESLFSSLSKGTGKKKVLALFDAELRLSRKRRSKKSIESTISATPIEFGSNTLEICGAEYRVKGEVSDGVSELRWSDKAKGHRKVWLHYSAHWAWEFAWDEEKQRCLTYIKDLF
jgi:hypothetical protein